MKKLVAVILACVFCVATAYAGEWADGLSPAKPHPLKDEVNLDETMGYIMLFPNAKLPVERFCDVLEIYLPREDLALGEGKLTLCDEEGEVAVIDFADAAQVQLRPLEDVELPRYWGGGTCVEMRLPRSLEFGKNYYVLMDEGCFTAADGKVQNPPITSNEAWRPVLNGEWGISGLYYSAAPEPEPEGPTEEELIAAAEAMADSGEIPTEEPTAAPEAEEEAEAAPIEPKMDHEVGDEIHFELLMGGDAKIAVVFSENDSVFFPTQQFTESCTVTGTITKEDLDWGVVFMDENGAVLEKNGRTVGIIYLT